MSFLRRHALAITVCLLGLASFALFSWAEWHYFIDQAHDHKQAAPSFWSREHIHDWVYNAASNWQSELLFGVLLVVVLHRIRGVEDET